MFPVEEEPSVREFFWSVWMVPSAPIAIPFVPFNPPEIEATGVSPAAMLRTENFAELVAVPPTSTSIVLLIGVKAFPSADVVHQLVPVAKPQLLESRQNVPLVSGKVYVCEAERAFAWRAIVAVLVVPKTRGFILFVAVREVAIS